MDSVWNLLLRSSKRAASEGRGAGKTARGFGGRQGAVTECASGWATVIFLLVCVCVFNGVFLVCVVVLVLDVEGNTSSCFNDGAILVAS